MDIKLLHINKQFDNKPVLKDLSLTFPEGHISCLMGSSGIGKTTLINLIMGLEEPDSGEITGLEDKIISPVFQEDRLIEHWDALNNIKLVCPKDVSNKFIEDELSKVGLYEDRIKAVISLSGGMRRRVVLLRALLSNGNLIILDEPFKGLDDELKIKVLEYVKKKTKGKTVIVVTHDIKDAELLGAIQVRMPE
ncbi:MAG TPA: ABC transporter ATP-binding protein [Clostridiales bacterium]|nr:ABC transporter ATP-binding protein [Clostridiales bacterium]